MNQTKSLIYLSLTLIGVLGLFSCSGNNGPSYVLTAWGWYGKQPGQFGTPRAILAQKGELFVIDRTGRIQKFDYEGNFILQWELEEIENGTPTDMAGDQNGDVWIADTHYSRILHFDREGELISSFGEYGEEPGKFVFPTDVAIGDNGEMFVTEYGHEDRIQVFTKEGEYLRGWGEYGTGDRQLNRAMGIVRGNDSLLYIADSVNHRVVVYNQKGEFIRKFGKEGKNDGEMSFPYDIDVDEQNNVYICEYGSHRVQKFTSEGKWLASWGGLGSEKGMLAQPWGVSVDEGKIFVADTKNHRVQVFQF